MDRKLQRHRADSLRQHGFLVDWSTRVMDRHWQTDSRTDRCRHDFFWITATSPFPKLLWPLFDTRFGTHRHCTQSISRRKIAWIGVVRGQNPEGGWCKERRIIYLSTTGVKSRSNILVVWCRSSTSHAHTVVWECCKDDRQSQWEVAKFDPQPTLNPSTDRHQIWNTWSRRGYLLPKKIWAQSAQGILPPPYKW